MVSLKFEGEVNDISERQLDFVRSVLGERGFTNETVLVAAVGKADDNFAANVKRFVVEKDGKPFSMVVKIAPTLDFLRSRMGSKLLFQTEHVLYTSLLPKFTEIEKGADIPESERLTYAKCYGSLSEEPNEIIILEDLKMSDYVMLDKTKSYTDETVKLVLKNFAIYHSLSYVLNKREPEIYKDYVNKLGLSWPLLLESDEMKVMFGQVENACLSLLDNTRHKNLIKGISSQLSHIAMKNYKIDKDSKYSVIQQGDSWTNNMLFKIEGDKPLQCCMIDYQLAGQNSPVADLHYMIFNCTDYETRSKHYHEWIDYYHAQLDKSLSNYGLKANFIYPRDRLDADLKRFGKYSFPIALMHATMSLMDTQKAADMKEAMKDENRKMEDFFTMPDNLSSIATCKAKIDGVINSFLDLGYL